MTTNLRFDKMSDRDIVEGFLQSTYESGYYAALSENRDHKEWYEKYKDLLSETIATRKLYYQELERRLAERQAS